MDIFGNDGKLFFTDVRDVSNGKIALFWGKSNQPGMPRESVKA